MSKLIFDIRSFWRAGTGRGGGFVTRRRSRRAPDGLAECTVHAIRSAASGFQWSDPRGDAGFYEAVARHLPLATKQRVADQGADAYLCRASTHPSHQKTSFTNRL